MVISREEVLSRRHEMMEDVVERLVPVIDKKLLEAERYPVVYEITPLVAAHPNLGNALVEVYSLAGWKVSYGMYRESMDSYGDQRGPAHHRLYFRLEEKEASGGGE